MFRSLRIHSPHQRRRAVAALSLRQRRRHRAQPEPHRHRARVGDLRLLKLLLSTALGLGARVLAFLAGAGLVGLPNAGKSTFLSAVSRAKPKVADYPFTTLTPVLGVVYVDQTEFVIADIPGLIEGAHEGAGLGHRFLGHVERCGALLHLIDCTEDDIVGAWKTIRGELEAYGGILATKPEIVALNKIDAIPEEFIAEKKAELEAATGGDVIAISGATGAGVDDALRILRSTIEQNRADEKTEAEMHIPVPSWTP